MDCEGIRILDFWRESRVRAAPSRASSCREPRYVPADEMLSAKHILANSFATAHICRLRNVRISSREHRRPPVRTNMLNSRGSSAGEMISVVELLSTCVDAAQRGCAEIRAVHQSGGQLASTLKDVDDPRSALTEADTNAQNVIISALRTTWPGLRIVGVSQPETLEPYTLHLTYILHPKAYTLHLTPLP